MWNKQQKNLPFQNWEYQAGSQFLSVLEGNSELLQQPLMTILNIIMFEVKNTSLLYFYNENMHIGLQKPMEYVQATSRINFDKSRLIWKSSRKSLLATATRKASSIIKGT